MGAGQLQEEIDPQWLEGFFSYRADVCWLVLAGFYCACACSYIILKLLCMQSPIIFLDWHQGRGPTMLIYYDAVIMKQGSCSIFWAGAVVIHHDSVLFQKGGGQPTSLRTGSLSCIDVFCLSPEAPPEFPPSYLRPQDQWSPYSCGHTSFAVKWVLALGNRLNVFLSLWMVVLVGALWLRNVSSNKDESLPSPTRKGADISDLSWGGCLLSLTNGAGLLPAAGWLAICWQLLDQPWWERGHVVGSFHRYCGHSYRSFAKQ